MRIKSLCIPTEIANRFDLDEVKMKKLDRIVILSGKNGAGKTRFLKLLPHVFAKISKSNLSSTSAKLLEEKANLASALENGGSEPANIPNYTENIRKRILELQQLEELHLGLEIDEMDKKPVFVHFVPQKTDLRDPFRYSDEHNIQAAGRLNDLGSINAESATIATIEMVLSRWISATYLLKDSGLSADEARKAVEDYNNLQSYIKTFLGTELTWSGGRAQLFGRRIGIAELSKGQKVLLMFCVLLYKQSANLDETIIMMDEPENHLHPAVLIEVLDKVAASVPNGQLWIATHSVNVLAHFDCKDLWFLEDKKISYAGNIPESVLRSLLGEEDEIERLRSFLNLPAEMAIEKFAYECLLPPGVVMTDGSDPQTTQIREIIYNLRKE